MDNKQRNTSLPNKVKGWASTAFQAVVRRPVLSSIIILVVAALLAATAIAALRDEARPTYTTNKGTSTEGAKGTDAPSTNTPKTNQSKPQSGATTPKQADPCAADPDICKFAASTYDYSKVAHTIEESGRPNGRPDLKSRLLSTDGKGNTRYVQYNTNNDDENVVYDGYVYKKDNSAGVWVKYPLSDPTAQPVYKPGTQSGVTIDHTKFSYKRGATVTCGSAQCVGYSVSSKDPDSSGWSASFVFELGTYRLHSYSFDASSSTYVHFTNKRITYADVAIAEPSPVKNP